ncbi:MAG: hypothetical protein JW726_17810 [Anaerolineales bacterium]|nr:hypothetical protein [Anaerolineales bacterium]
MRTTRKLGMAFFALAIVISILACGGSAEPTPTNPPPPTNTVPPPPPTDTPLPPPTEAPPPTEPPAPTEAPPPTEDTGGGVAPNRVAGQINVIEVNGYKDSWDDWHIVGLISNDTDRFVNDIEVEVEIFDASENSLFVDTTYTALYSLAPGEITPFELYVYEDLTDPDHFVASITGNGTSSAERGTVDIQNVTLWLDEFDDIHLVGELVNNSSDIINMSGLAAAMFDDAGALATVDTVNAMIRYLEPGDSGPFRITIDAPEDQAASLTDYTIYTDAQITDATDKYDLTLSEEHYDYVDAYDNFHLVGSVTNNSDQLMNVSLVAGLYDDAGNVVDAATASLPVYSLAPGETMGYDFDFWGPVNYAAGAYDAATEYNVQIDWYWTWDTTTELVDLTTVEDTNTFDSYSGTFNGKVSNSTGAEIESATVIVSIYDKATGQLVAVSYDWLFDPIPNGGTGDYEVYVDIPDGFAIENYEYVITVKGEK